MREQWKLSKETDNRFSDFTVYITIHETYISCHTAPTLTVILSNVCNKFLYS